MRELLAGRGFLEKVTARGRKLDLKELRMPLPVPRESSVSGPPRTAHSRKEEERSS